MTPFRLLKSVITLANKGVLGQNERNDQSVQAQSLGENKNQNHTNEQLLLLPDSADASITHNANRHACRQAGETAAQAGR
jgi:hypothetical protein